MIARTRRTRSRSPRRPNEIFRAMASFPAGLHDPFERERVSLLVQAHDIDFHDPALAVTEIPTSDSILPATPRLPIARDSEPIRPPILVCSHSNVHSQDLTAAQMFVDPYRLPRTPPREDSPDRPHYLDSFNQVINSTSRDVHEDFREVRDVIHNFTPRQLYLLQQGVRFYQCRQFCLMPCHRCITQEGRRITYQCKPCVRPRLPELRQETIRMHHECLCAEHFVSNTGDLS